MYFSKLTFLKLAILLLLSSILVLLLARPINLTTADLGRHLVNGELFWKQGLIPDTNLYSYTHPDFPFTNHHWGAGALFWVIHALTGFVGLSIVFIAMNLAAFLLLFDIARREAGFAVATILSPLAIPLIAARGEVRPEGFSTLFIALFFWILWRYTRRDREPPKLAPLLILPALQLLWVNTHIFFIAGLFIIGAFFLEALLAFLWKKEAIARIRTTHLGWILAVSALLTFVNANGIRGVLAPFSILKEYGYRIVENQPVWFVERIIDYPPGLFLKIALALLVASWVYACIKKGQKISPAYVIISISFGIAAWQAIRIIPLFGFFLLPILAANIYSLWPKKRNQTPISRLAIGAGSAAALLLLLSLANPAYMRNRIFGVGLAESVNAAMAFYQEQHIQGPIFNNYDIGSFLVYHLYPEERVFVENRPEAYPVKFFQEQYIPMQQDNELWNTQQNKNEFNTIFFYRHDLTPWAQQFLLSRVADPEWAVVYFGPYNTIMLKRDGPNQTVIDQYEIPKEMFIAR